MKNSHVALLTMMAAVFQFSCEESVEPTLTAQEVEQKVIDKIEKNEGISYDLFHALGEGVDAETINRFKLAASTQEEFVTSIAEESDDYFEAVVEKNMADFRITTIPMPFSGTAELKLRKLIGTDDPNALPYWPWETGYSSLILAEIDKQAAEGHKEWIIIESLDDDSGVKTMPVESVSLNYAKIKMLATEVHKVFMNMSLTDEQVLVTINEMMISHEIPPTAVALLVPAVQKVREAAANSEPFGDALKVYLDGTVGQAINGTLDRDIIRRIQATSFLAGLHTILLPEYDNANQDMASLSIMHARYRAAIAGASGGIWKTTN